MKAKKLLWGIAPLMALAPIVALLNVGTVMKQNL